MFRKPTAGEHPFLFPVSVPFQRWVFLISHGLEKPCQRPVDDPTFTKLGLCKALESIVSVGSQLISGSEEVFLHLFPVLSLLPDDTLFERFLQLLRRLERLFYNGEFGFLEITSTPSLHPQSPGVVSLIHDR